jgi:hypothetical protein
MCSGTFDFKAACTRSEDEHAPSEAAGITLAHRMHLALWARPCAEMRTRPKRNALPMLAYGVRFATIGKSSLAA